MSNAAYAHSIDQSFGNFGSDFAAAIKILFRKPQHILYIGASVTAQRNSFLLVFHELVCRMTGHKHSSSRIAVGGTGSILQYYLYRQKRAFFETQPNLVIFECFTGDLNGLVPANLIPDVLGALAEDVRSAGGQVCVVNSYRSDRHEPNEFFDSYAHASTIFSIPFVNLYNEFRNRPLFAEDYIKHTFRDGIHTTDPGSEFLGTLLAAIILSPRSYISEHIEAAPGYGSNQKVLRALEIIRDGLDVEGAVANNEIDEITTIPNGDTYKAVVVHKNQIIKFRFTGYLAYLMFIAGPDSNIVDLTFGGTTRKMNVFDRNCYYRRFKTIPIFRNFQDEIFELSISDRPIDLSIIPPDRRDQIVSGKTIRFIGILAVPNQTITI